MPIYEYECECGISESIEPIGTKEIKCKCGKIAKKIVSINQRSKKWG